MDTVCPLGTYTMTKKSETWTAAMCGPCPDDYPLTGEIIPSIDMCYNSLATCEEGEYYDTVTAQCVTCPANSYCPGGVQKNYYDGAVVEINAVSCPVGATSPEGSSSPDACQCDDGFVLNALGACSPLCDAGMTMLRTSAGLVAPIFATKNTVPAMVVKNGENVCYVDLSRDKLSNTINLKINKRRYYVVQ